MLDAQSLSLFISASLLLALTPGPDIIFVISQSLIYNARAGLIVTLGLCTGLIIHSTVVTLGLASVIRQSPLLLLSLQLLGAVYLLYIAWQIHKSKTQLITTSNGLPLHYTKLYLRGFVMNITNPKVMLFFMAFLPQFINLEQGDVALQIGILGLLFMLVTMVVFGGMAIASRSLIKWVVVSEKAQHKLNNVVASTLFILAVYMGVSTVI